MKNWNIYANVGLRLIDQVQRQNLNKVYEHNVVGEALELAYGGEYAVGQTGAMQYWTKANHLTTSLYSDYSFSFDEHQFKVMAGVNTEKYNNRYLSVKRMDLITESVPESALQQAKIKLMKPVLTLGLQRVSLDVLTMIIPINILLLVTYAMTVLLVSSEKTVGDCSVRFL